MTEIVRPLAIGLDIVDIRRIASVLDKYPHRFAERIFTHEERRRADRRPQGAGVNNSRAATYARRFAAKEACAKALGTGVATTRSALARYRSAQLALGCA